MTRKRRALRKAAPEKNVNNFRDPEASRFDNFKNVAYGGMLAVFAVAVSLNDFKEMWIPSSTPLIMFGARILFFVELVFLMFRWIIATHHEMDLWGRWLDNPFTKQDVYTAIFGLAVVLGLLVAFPHKILFTSGFMTVYFLINYWTQWLANDHFARALQRTRARGLSAADSNILKIMEYFWLKRPQLARIVTMMFFSSIAFNLALAGELQPEPQKTRFQLGSYALLMTIILIGELVIAWWRHKLDQEIIANSEE